MSDCEPSAVERGVRLATGARVKNELGNFNARIGDSVGARCDWREADQMAAEAAQLLALPEPMPIGAGRELCLSEADAERKPGLVDTVADPDAVTAQASVDRVELAAEAGCLALAIDAADTIRPGNSLEKMLAHQLAAAHASAMRLIARAENEMSKEYWDHQIRADASQSASRLLNTAARLMATFQDGLETLRRMRSGGQQTVVVHHQHVTVTDGGKAVIANTLKAGDGGA